MLQGNRSSIRVNLEKSWRLSNGVPFRKTSILRTEEVDFVGYMTQKWSDLWSWGEIGNLCTVNDQNTTDTNNGFSVEKEREDALEIEKRRQSFETTWICLLDDGILYFQSNREAFRVAHSSPNSSSGIPSEFSIGWQFTGYPRTEACRYRPTERASRRNWES